MVVILGIALPITEILSNRIPAEVYQGFYVYLYIVSITFVIFIYVSQLRRKAVFTIIKNYREFKSDVTFFLTVINRKFIFCLQTIKRVTHHSRNACRTSEAFI